MSLNSLHGAGIRTVASETTPRVKAGSRAESKAAAPRAHARGDRAQVSALDAAVTTQALAGGVGLSGNAAPAPHPEPAAASVGFGAKPQGVANRVSGAQAEGRRDGRQSGPLEYNGKSSTPPCDKVKELRAERYFLQSVARDLFRADGSAKGLQYPSNRHDTAKCLYTRIAPDVDVMRSKEHGRAFYAGLVVCGKVWTCPVCAAKIQERRRLEVAQAFDWAYSNGKKVVMVTFTFPHYHWQRLADLLPKQAEAYKRLRAGKPWDKLKTSIGYTGLIRSLEITLGANGWHPHTHEAWIVDRDCDTKALRRKVVARWLTMCRKVGLVPDGKTFAFLKRSVQITDNCSTSDYLAKQDDSRNWGMDRELVKASSKVRKSSKGMHPFGLLADAGAEEPERSDSGARFLEYADAMKGKAQLFWSRGLKDLVGVTEATDEELAAEQQDRADHLAKLSREEWRLVLKRKARAELLDAAEVGGAEAVQRWLSDNVTAEPLPTDDSPTPKDSAGATAIARRKIWNAAPEQPTPTDEDEMDKLLQKARSDLAAESRGVQGS